MRRSRPPRSTCWTERISALEVPAVAGVLRRVATIPVAEEGQAVAWDRSALRRLYGISRRTGEVVDM